MTKSEFESIKALVLEEAVAEAHRCSRILLVGGGTEVASQQRLFQKMRARLQSLPGTTSRLDRERAAVDAWAAILREGMLVPGNDLNCPGLPAFRLPMVFAEEPTT